MKIDSIIYFIHNFFKGLHYESEEIVDYVSEKLSDLIGCVLYIVICFPLFLLKNTTEFFWKLCETNKLYLKHRHIFMNWYKEHKEELDK